MNNLMNNNSQFIESARELHTILGIGRDFTNWFKYQIERFGLKEGIDFMPSMAKSTGGRPGRDFMKLVDHQSLHQNVEGEKLVLTVKNVNSNLSVRLREKTSSIMKPWRGYFLHLRHRLKYSQSAHLAKHART